MAAHATSITSRKVGGFVFAFLILFAAMLFWPQPAVTQTSTDGPVATLALKDGEVKIRLRPDLAPNHVERIAELANAGFYDNIKFHRVIAGFMAQTGDPQGTGMGGSHLPDLAAEFSNANFARGTVGMARSANPNSANSQFFIVTADSPHLNGQYTLFGEVIEGMEFVDAIKLGDPRANGVVTDPDLMISLRVSAPE